MTLQETLTEIADTLAQLRFVGEVTKHVQVRNDPVWVAQAEAHLAEIASTLCRLQALIIAARASIPAPASTETEKGKVKSL